MNIGFEAKRFFTNNTGLGNYGRFVIRALSTHAPDNTYFLYTPRLVAHPDTTDILQRQNVAVVTPPAWHKMFRTTSLWRRWGISREATVKNLQVFHGLSQELPAGLPPGLKKIVTVHDLIFYRYPQFYNAIDVAIYKQKLKHACRHADRIIAISQQTKLDLISFLEVEDNKIDIIYQGSHPNFKRAVPSAESEQLRKKYKLPASYLLSVGTIEARKNLMVIVKALALLPRESRIPLVILGRPTDYLKEVLAVARQLDVIHDIILPAGVSFFEFPAIYQHASVFVYPSLFEGFGIPLIEAIESGVPVITSTGSCFSEAAGPASVFVDPHDAEALAFEIGRLLSDRELRRTMVAESQAYIRRFEPEVIGKQLINLYKR